MKNILIFYTFVFAIAVIFLLSSFDNNCKNKIKELPNTLTKEEIKEGWKLLFDGTTTIGWRGVWKEKFPEKGWQVKDGMLTVLASDGAESTNGGDIVTIDEYSDFELKVDFKLTPVANSGIKYFVTESEGVQAKSALGLEFQILDDDKHPDAKLGRDGNRTIASLYDLIPAKNKKPNPIGEWNHARIISKGKHVEHWLNDTKVVEYERGSEDFLKLIAISKYKDKSGFGLADKGHILLQDHGNEVSFRNIKIKILN